MNRLARLRRLECQLLGSFASGAALDRAIEAERSKLEPEEQERFLAEFLREEGWTLERTDGRRTGKTP
jgi:hypothetical protein